MKPAFTSVPVQTLAFVIIAHWCNEIYRSDATVENTHNRACPAGISRCVITVFDFGAGSAHNGVRVLFVNERTRFAEHRLVFLWADLHFWQGLAACAHEFFVELGLRRCPDVRKYGFIRLEGIVQNDVESWRAINVR